MENYYNGNMENYYNGNMENQIPVMLAIEFFSFLDIILNF